LVIITDAREAEAGGRMPPHQVFDQPALFAPITKAARRLRPEDGVDVLEDLLDFALDQPEGPIHIDLSAESAGTAVTAASPPPRAAAREGVTGDRATAENLRAASRRPAILAGTQARAQGVAAPLRQFAEKLRCPVLTSYKAKGVLADSHPQVIGHFTGARAEFDALARADLVLVATNHREYIEMGTDPLKAAGPTLFADIWNVFGTGKVFFGSDEL